MSEQEYTNDAEHIAHLTKRIRDAEQMAETCRKMAGDSLKVVARQREALELVVKQHKGDLGAPSWFDMMESVKAVLAQEPPP